MNKPTKIGKYDVIDQIGRGGMGVVYKANDPELNRFVAIKMMTVGYTDEPDLLKRFYREAQSTASLQHPNIVTVFNLGDQDGNPYMVMQYLEGESLDAIISSRRPIPMLEKIQIILDTCQGLSYAHERGIVHRDIKPGNIMVCKEGGAKLVDFGIAHIASNTLTRTGQIMGSINYMSPEQINGEALDPRTDIWSTGVVLYQLLTYSLPFEAETTAAALLKIIHDPPPPLDRFLSVYPRELDPILTRALAKNRADRYVSADELAMDLLQVHEQLKQETVSQHLQEAEVLVQRGDLNRAKDRLLQLLKLEQKNTHAVKLLRQVQQKIEKEHGGQQARKLRAQAEESYSQGEFEAALHYLNQAITLDTSNPELPKFIELVRQAKVRAEELRQALRRAESAHERGDLDAARQAADEALQINGDDTQAKALYRIIHRDWEERARLRQLESLLEAARREIKSRNLTAALGILKQAQPLDPQGIQVGALVDEVNAGRDQELRRKELERVNREVEEALNRDDYETAFARLESGLQQFPQDRGLAQLKALAQKQRASAERRSFVNQQIAVARELLDAGQASTALASLQNAVRKVPGQPELETLLAMVQERVARDETERAKSSTIQQARDALAQHAYIEAIQILEAGQVRFVDSPEIDSLLQFAREQDLTERGRRAVEDATRRAQQWISENQYARAIQLLESTLAQTPDDQLSIILDETRHRFDDHQRDLRAAIAKAQQFLRDGTATKAGEFLAAQPESYSRSPEFNVLVETAHKLQVIEAVERQVANELDVDSQVNILEQAQRKYPNYTNWDARLQPIRERRKFVLAIVQRARKFEREKKYRDALQEWRQLQDVYGQYPNLAVEIERLQQLQEKEYASAAAIASAKQTADRASEATTDASLEIMATRFFDRGTDDETDERGQIRTDSRGPAHPQQTDIFHPTLQHLDHDARELHVSWTANRKTRAIGAVAAVIVMGSLGTWMWTRPAGPNPKPSSDQTTIGGSTVPSTNPVIPQPASTPNDEELSPSDQSTSLAPEKPSAGSENVKPIGALEPAAKHEKISVQSSRKDIFSSKAASPSQPGVGRLAQPVPTTPIANSSANSSTAKAVPPDQTNPGNVGSSARGTDAATSNPPAAKPTSVEPSTQSSQTLPMVAEAKIPASEISRIESTRPAPPIFPDRDAIQAVLDRYANAYSSRDSKQVTSVFPSISREKLNIIRSFFKEQKSIRMSLAIQKLVPLDDNHVVLSCSQSLQYSEDGKTRNTTATVTINMVKRANGWQIAEIPIS